MSLQAFFLRAVLQLRKAAINWDAPVDKFRAELKLGDRFTKLPENVELKRDLAAGVPVEWIIPPNVSAQSVILYIHGGAWTMGWNNLHRRMLSYLCQAVPCRALAVDYRLAPEHPFPAPLEDCLTVYRWLVKNSVPPQSIMVAGDSAGANLTLAMLIALRDAADPLPAAAVCISPMTDLAGTGESFRTKRDAALAFPFALTMARHYAGDQDLCLPFLSPHYGDLYGLPPLMIQVGEDEILLSDAERLAVKAQTAGVDVTLVIWPKMWHVWHLFAPFLPEAQEALNGIAAFIRKRLHS